MQTRRRTNLLWGVIALALAAALLLHALDLLPPGVHDLLTRSWPALLIAAGLSIFLRPRLPFGSALALIVTAALVGGVAALAFSTRASQERSDYRAAIDQPIAPQVTLLRLRVETLATSIALEPAASADRRVAGQFTGSLESAVEVAYVEEGPAANLIVREARPAQIPLLENVGRGALRLALPPDLPLDIEVRGADGDTRLDLTGVALERLNLDLRQGSALVTLPQHKPIASGPQDLLGTLAVRSGDLTLFIPRAVAARLELDRGGSGIEPEFDPALYNYLVGDVLQAANITTADIVMRFAVVIPRGRVRVVVPPE
ncbi:MAG: LiaI-LiaF-like domain-containing protein [Aggregatilineales bacterium]